MSALFHHHAAWINMQAVIGVAFMIVDSFGHYLAQTVHDHGLPVGPPEKTATLCRVMDKYTSSSALISQNRACC
jgi:hypothetical protein